MNLIFHAGAHFTEERRLLKSLQRNKEDWAPRGIAVPAPSQYRKQLRQRLAEPPRLAKIAGIEGSLLDQIMPGTSADRVILSNANLFGLPRRALRKGVLYSKAPQRVAGLAEIFPDDDIQIFMALRNPATFLPCAFEKSPQDSLKEYLSGADPRLIRWSDTLSAIRAAAPQVPITVWCNEDAVFLWPRIIREMAGLAETEAVKGGFALLKSIMTQEGMTRFTAYLASNAIFEEAQIQEATEIFLRDFARQEAVREEINLPGWTEDLVAQMTADYHDDAERISRIPGVTMMMP